MFKALQFRFVAALAVVLFTFLTGQHAALAAAGGLDLTEKLKALKLKDKIKDKISEKNFFSAKVKYKGKDVTVLAYLPKGKSEPITALVFDTFDLSNYIKDAKQKALLKDFTFRNAVLIAVPQGSQVNGLKVKDLPIKMVKALGGAKSRLFPIDLKTGVTFAADAGLNSGSDPEVLMTAFGASKTSHFIKGRLSDEFLDIFDILKGVPIPNLLAYLNLNFSIPAVESPVGLKNTYFNIGREKDSTGKATGVLFAKLYSDIILKSKGKMDVTVSTVNISYSADTGVRFGPFDWPNLPELPWVKITDVKLSAKIKKDIPPLSTLMGNTVNLKAGLKTTILTASAMVSVNKAPKVLAETTYVFKGKKIIDVQINLPGRIKLGKLPGLRNIPGLEGISITDPIISANLIGGKLTIGKLGIKDMPARIFKFDGSKDWNVAVTGRNLSIGTFIKNLKGSVLEKARLKEGALILSKAKFSGKVGDFPSAIRDFLKKSLPNDNMSLTLAPGLNIGGKFAFNGSAGDVFKKMGVPDEMILFGGVNQKKKTLNLSGHLAEVALTGLPFTFNNNFFNIVREGRRGLLKGSISSDITVDLPEIGKLTFPSVNISKLLGGIKLSGLKGINLPKLPGLSWATISDVRFDTIIGQDSLSPSGGVKDVPITVSMGATGKFKNSRKVPVDVSFTVTGKKITSPEFSFHYTGLGLGKIRGLGKIPGINGMSISNPTISANMIGGDVTIEKLGINALPARIFKIGKSRDWNIAIRQDNLSMVTLVKKLKGTILEKMKLKDAALIISKSAFTGQVSELPASVRKWLKGPLPNDDMPLSLASGLNIGGTFVLDGIDGTVKDALNTLGAPDQMVLFGGVTNMFNAKKPSFRMSGDFPELKIPNLGVINLPKPKNPPALFMEYVNKQPAIGAEVVEDNFSVKYAIGPKGMTLGATLRSWNNALGINGLDLSEVAITTGTGNLEIKGGLKINNVTDRIELSAIGGVLSGASLKSKEISMKRLMAFVDIFAGTNDLYGTMQLNALPQMTIKPANGNNDVEITYSVSKLNGFKVVASGLLAVDVVGQKADLAIVDIRLDDSSLSIDGNVILKNIGPLNVNKAKLRGEASLTKLPKLEINTEIDLLGAKNSIDLAFSQSGFMFHVDNSIPELFDIAIKATGTGFRPNSDFTIAGTVSQNFDTFFRDRIRAPLNAVMDSGLGEANKAVEGEKKKT